MTILDSYTVKGSEIGIDRYDFEIVIRQDGDEHPDNFDCYTPRQKQAWRWDQWRFVGVEITPVRNGVTVHGARNALWSVEYGNEYVMTDENDKVTGTKSIGRPELLEHPIKDMARVVAEDADKLIAAL